MPKYALLSTLTPEGRKTLHQHPERIRAVDDEIATFGCKVIDQYAVLRPYDLVTVVEAPDNETVAHLSVDLGSRGTVNMMTLPAISIDEFAAQLQSSEQLEPLQGKSITATRTRPSPSLGRRCNEAQLKLSKGGRP